MNLSIYGTGVISIGTGRRTFRSVNSARQRCSRLVCAAQLKLYTNPRSRGRIIEWYLQEIGKDTVDLVNMDFAADVSDPVCPKGPAFLEVNPFGKLPALEDDGFKMFESGAMLLYIAEKYGGVSTTEDRAVAAQWTLFANSTLANAIFVEAFREKQMPVVMGKLDEILSTKDYLLGSDFSVSDVAVGAYLLYIPAFFPNMDLSDYPSLLAYMDRLRERPACAATVAATPQS